MRALGHGKICPPMSALGHKRTFRSFRPMSALPPKADVLTSGQRLGFGFHEPHELHGIDFADGNQARFLGGLDGAIESLPARLGLLLLVAVRRVLSIKFLA